MGFRRLGLTERLLAILLLVAAVDFLANTYLFDSATTTAVQRDDAARIGELLALAARAVSREVPARRTEAARALATRHFELEWKPSAAPGELRSPDPALATRILAAGPELAAEGQRLIVRHTHGSRDVTGIVVLADGSALGFRTYAGEISLQLSFWQILPMLLPTLLLGALAWLMFRATMRSLQTLVKALRHIETPSPGGLPEQGPDEVRRLIRAFNQMQRRIQRQQAERTQSMLAIGHDLRTPLARLQLRLDGAALEEETRAELEHDIGEMRHLLESLQAFVEAGGTQIPPQRIDIAIMAATLVDSAADQGLDARYDGPDSFEIMARAVSIRRAMSNLIDNALHYAGNVRVTLARAGDAVEIRVEDDGPGIPQDRLEEVFQPFFRLDTARTRDTPGMGLGLSIVQAAVKLEGGTLTLHNKSRADGAGTGLAAIIRLPLPAGAKPA
ncbi:histidine kinase [Novosphingobium fuchskuhlense]|uniref:histidine kinase n=1 Tax=Novosphingobium fuchskuhlense TaxID=1117702 RepID=A0A117UYK1_9SPHN|nr:histidine kinase [Novosphingobium fuchskuhlense]